MDRRATNESPEIALEDVRVIQRMARGDSAALGELYDRWSDAVYAAAISIVGVAEDAEEVVEDTSGRRGTRHHASTSRVARVARGFSASRDREHSTSANQ